MTNIEEIKQVMRSDREKINSFCIYVISKAGSIASSIYKVEPNMCRTRTRTRNCGRTFNKKDKNTYGTAAAEALDLGSVSSPAMSSRRLSTSGKKSFSGK